jgi:predicted lipoprotein with Yx(FWY)xxD motif
MNQKFVACAIAAVALLAACGGSSNPSTAATSPSPAAASPSPSPAATGEKIMVATNAKLGQILVDESGMTVYLFMSDTPTASTCYTTCATIWPPVVTTGAPQAGTGATASLLGTITRTDGKVEVTYNGHPLYYFVQDKAAGDAKGQGINGFGALWWVLSPAGAAITTK